MKIYLLRHGLAEDAAKAGNDDVRRLTSKGAKKTRNAVRGMRAIGCRPRRVIASPLVRAQQTAEIATQILWPKGEVENSGLLTPESPPGLAASWLCRQPETEIMAVGHMPHLSRLASFLVSNREDAWLHLRKSGACAIEFEGDPEPGSGLLLWLMEPEQLADLG